eukprot:Lankesteria_metandrocarpae@DN6107_c0_g1_i1.p1
MLSNPAPAMAVTATPSGKAAHTNDSRSATASTHPTTNGGGVHPFYEHRTAFLCGSTGSGPTEGSGGLMLCADVPSCIIEPPSARLVTLPLSTHALSQYKPSTFELLLQKPHHATATGGITTTGTAFNHTGTGAGSEYQYGNSGMSNNNTLYPSSTSGISTAGKQHDYHNTGGGLSLLSEIEASCAIPVDLADVTVIIESSSSSDDATGSEDDRMHTGSRINTAGDDTALNGDEEVVGGGGKDNSGKIV